MRRTTLLALASVAILLTAIGAAVARDTPRPATGAITVDAGKVGEPISKYVYGQFIEHLGRCIYGGIWAEMLQDRKFFYPVGSKESPWKVIGPADAVKMVREGAFVGQ